MQGNIAGIGYENVYASDFPGTGKSDNSRFESPGEAGENVSHSVQTLMPFGGSSKSGSWRMILKSGK